MSMATTGIFTTHAYQIRTKVNEERPLLIWGDVHRDSELCAVDRWKEFLVRGRAAGTRALFLGMGDYFDNCSTSERDILGDPKLHETTKKNMEECARKGMRDFAREISFMAGRLVGLVEGNHYFQFKDGTTSTQYLCQLLGCKYLGVATFIRLSFIIHGNTAVSFDIHAHHGKGASRQVGGSLNRVAQMLEHCDADLVVMGHDHKRGIVPANPSLRLEEYGGALVVKERQSWIARSGSFLAAYSNGMASYNVDAARGPCNLGHIEARITPRRERRNGVDRVWLDVKGVA